ncbi:MAG: TaqI-like C-terminal specificity domain-containing protein [Candidatus Binatia bacterium]
MVDYLFRCGVPDAESAILDPGCGDGAIIEGIVRWCRSRKLPLPRIIGVEREPHLAAASRALFAGYPSISIVTQDFLASEPTRYQFVIGNPPYVPITALSAAQRSLFKGRFESACGRFDLYILFFEQAVKCLQLGGRLVFITPEKFLYVESARPLRKLLAQKWVEEIRLVDERTFGGLVTYPTITTLVNTRPDQRTLVIRRDGSAASAVLPKNGDSWLPTLNGATLRSQGLTLGDVCLRISCGVATGADGVFVRKSEDIEPDLLPFAYPTLAGRELNLDITGFNVRHAMLIPYSSSGRLLSEAALGALRSYLVARRTRLVRRTCVGRKPWYAFHETPPLPVILRPKILCKDIAAHPRFWVSAQERLVPRHSVYYIVPKNQDAIELLCDYLNSPSAKKWLMAHCQRAANGFIRLQSHILKQLPIPTRIAAALRPKPQPGADKLTTSSHRRGGQLGLPLSDSSRQAEDPAGRFD